eukprot:CAMPEP_0183703344 /NCGR_PEP_ID=MMETSP0737-20130205/1116_1 /TAXON_ID=385413 /ORGANISM="Thalassiosira miniscula, Strain CCMP1093" /LENGTH=451 /DNA_ID=CAMNT_0025930075 /DNA_START=19 /DNA_END=1374 /DNA_ORIENTATION=+
MRAAKASILLLQLTSHLSRCSCSSFGRRSGLPSSSSVRAFQKSTAVRQRTRRQQEGDDAHHHVSALSSIYTLRGGQQAPDAESTPSYHGNYVSPGDGEPPAAAAAVMSATVETPPPEEAAPPVAVSVSAPAPAPPVLAKDASTSKKLSNLQERTGPAILMLGAVYLLLKFTGAKGLIGLVYLMQIGLYSESTNVVESFGKKEGGEVDDEIASFGLQKWWWFATAVMFTSGRKMITDHTSLSLTQANLLTFGMSSVSLVGAVMQLAMISSDAAEDIYRRYLGKVACCHFSLLFLVGQSTFWIKTVTEYGLVWVLFPALLVVVNDTMAYVFGVLLGKHKLLPRLSPKKTVEGFVGAGLSTLAVATPLLKKMLGSSDAATVADLSRHAFLLATYVSLVSPFGGFLASAVKRAHGAKDFGALIPGHGGVVDRFDCQVVTAPFVYLYLKHCLASAE